MRTVLLASLRRNTRRYVAATLAVVIGVGFVIVLNTLTGATRDGLTADAGAPYDAAGLVVVIESNEQVGPLKEAADDKGVPATTIGYATEPVARHGIQLTDSATISEVPLDPAQRWLELEEGRHPTRPGESLADVNAAKSSQVEVGDVVTVGAGDQVVETKVVGMVDSPPVAGADLWVPWEDLQQLDRSLWVQALTWGGTGELADRVSPGADVRSADDWVASVQAEVSRGVDVIAIMALLFVAISLFVATLVIANTFSILFAQRMRDFALLRCVGVTRRQLRRSVRLEALALGLAASVLGVAFGALAGLGVVRVVGHWWSDMGEASLSPTWMLGAVALGTLVTLGAAWLPTRAVTRVTPLAALRPDTGVSVRSSAGLLRMATAALAVVGGTGLLAASMRSHQPLLMIAGGAAAFVGVLLLGPVLVPALIRVAGRLTGDGPVRRLAAGNAVRNPRRTATTAASLLVGVTLTTAVLTGLDTSRTSIDEEMDASYPLDSTVTATTRALPDDLSDRVRALDGVADAVGLDGVVARIGDVEVPLVAVAERASVVRGEDDLTVRDGVLRLPWSVTEEELTGQAARSLSRDREVVVRVGDREQTLRVRQGDGWGRAGLVSAATMAGLTETVAPMAVWARARTGADAEDLEGDLAALAGAAGAGTDGGYGNREYVDLQVDILTGAVVGLLAIAIVIALIGIANTLGLSVLERARENALLRAMGLTRQQLRHAMAVEGLLLSLVATALGTALGVAFAWVGVDVLVSPGVPDAAMTIPLGQLALVVAVAALAGLLACVVPARRAARVTPAAGLAVE